MSMPRRLLGFPTADLAADLATPTSVLHGPLPAAPPLPRLQEQESWRDRYALAAAAGLCWLLLGVALIVQHFTAAPAWAC